MKKRRFIIPFFLLASMTLASCKRNIKRALSGKNINDEKTASELPANPEIVCWGDSMTFGTGKSRAIIHTDSVYFDASDMSYPDVLQELTGLKTCNFGVPSATSKDIAIMQGGLVTLNHKYMQVINKDIIREGEKHPGDILILEIGSNGGWEDYEDLISQYKSMLKHVNCSHYIIIGDTDDPENSADPLTAEIADNIKAEDSTPWEDALSQAFGDHFINMRLQMLRRGLTLSGLSATPDETEAMSRGIIPEQLRADWTHFNSYGYYAKGVILYEKGQALGYWK